MNNPFLTLVPYLQSWEPTQGRLRFRVLVVPFDNPLVPRMSGVPAFADADLTFRVLFDNNTDRLPDLDDFGESLAGIAITVNISSPPADRRALFEAIEEDYRQQTGGASFKSSKTTLPEQPQRQLKAYLPNSYRQAFAFTEPRTPLAVIDDEYKCLMRCPPASTSDEPPLSELSWNEMMSLLLQRPKLAEVAGLIHEITVSVRSRGTFYREGGWLAVTLAAPGQYLTLNPRLYATRVPVLEMRTERPVFTPVVFPVGAANKTFDSIFIEAVRFDDGFSKIVHARQPISSDLLTEREDDDRGTRQLIKDEGIQLGWDNEDVVSGQNRSIGMLVDGEGEAPRGIIGYRVDVRPKGNTAVPWVSLSSVEEPLPYPTPYENNPIFEERWTGVYPNEVDGQLWLPMYFERWTGRSLVWNSPEETELRGIAPNNGTTGDAGRPIWPNEHPLGSPPDLQYGTDYDFRVRLADTTGGGPSIDDMPVRSGEAPIASINFRRYIPMEHVKIAGTEPDGTPTQTALLAKEDTRPIPPLSILRPSLGYPAAVYTRYGNARADLEENAREIREGRVTARRPEIPDPDAKYLQIRVLVRMPAFDPSGEEENGYAELYRTYRPFEIPENNENQALLLDFRYVRANNISSDINLSDQPQSPSASINISSLSVRIPTNRDVRVELSAVGEPDPEGSYFGTEEARFGDELTLNVHAVAFPEVAFPETVPEPVFREKTEEVETLQTFFVRDVPAPNAAPSETITSQVRPSPETLARFAAAADLAQYENTIAGPLGVRTVFGCAGLKHHLAPDGSSIELSEPGEITGQFVSVVRATLDRDWSWRGAGAPFVKVHRTIHYCPEGAECDSDNRQEIQAETLIGTIELLHAVNAQATRGNPDRSRTELVFIDAFTPVNVEGRSEELQVTYKLTPLLQNSFTPGELTVTNRLPIVSPPVQRVEIAGAGYALSPFGHTEDYSATSGRSRRLWLEIKEPLADQQRYALFGRVIRHAPDPMLIPGFEASADAIGIDRIPLPPEYIRQFVPGQPRDFAGFNIMQRLEPVTGSNGKHFMLPLPPNMKHTSPHLFDFFTYEFAVGYDVPQGAGKDAAPWVTAQARFGPTVTVEGIQHPPPPLPCDVFENVDEESDQLMINVQSTFATPYDGQRRLVHTQDSERNTEIHFVLFARLTQVDGATMRNVPIDIKPGKRSQPSNSTRDETAAVNWRRMDVSNLLSQAGLPQAAPLSVMAVEMLPEPSGKFGGPLRGDLGQVRILRTSALEGVELTCCV